MVVMHVANSSKALWVRSAVYVDTPCKSIGCVLALVNRQFNSEAMFVCLCVSVCQNQKCVLGFCYIFTVAFFVVVCYVYFLSFFFLSS